MRGLEVVEFVIDEGVSGRDLDRDGMKRVLDLAAIGAVDAVVVTKADRVNRNVRDLLNLSATLEAHGVGLVTADEQFDATTPLERDMAATRTRDGRASARAKGVRLGRPPVGWRIIDGRWEPTDRHPLVVRVHTMR